MSGTPPTPSALSAFTPDTLVQRYPNLPRWAISTFFEFKHSKDYVISPEARALLNIAMLGYKHDQDQKDCNVKVRDLFVDDQSYMNNKEHIDLCRLSHDMAGM
jgi:hypothetical protein